MEWRCGITDGRHPVNGMFFEKRGFPFCGKGLNRAGLQCFGPCSILTANGFGGMADGGREGQAQNGAA
jgi:hypothetical protein